MGSQDILTAISTYGFPIVMCVYLLWQQRETDKNNRETLNNLQKTIRNNTKVMTVIATKVGITVDLEDEDGK